MHILKKSILAASICSTFLLSGCFMDSDTKAKPPVVVPEPIKFTVLHTNDNHGRFWENSYGEYGMSARKTLIDEIRAEVTADGGEVLLLSGGDINTGVPESDLQDAVPDFVGMNLLGYDAMAVGNHEFDNPMDVLDMQQGIALFPFISANIYDKATNERIFDPYNMFEINGLKIAIMGLTTEDTGKLANPEYVGGLEFTDPKVEAAALIEEIAANETADLVFAVTHMGHYANGQSGSNAPGDVALANSLDTGDLDMIIGGHSQNPVCVEMSGEYSDFNPGDDCTPDQQNGTYIVQAHEWGKYVGRADFEYLDGELTLVEYQLIPVNLKVKDADGNRVLVGEEIIPDPLTLSILAPYQEQGGEELDVVLAQTDDKLEGDRAVVRSEQTNMGRLIAEAQRQSIPGASFAIMNSGGVRDSIAAGDVTYRDVLTVQPFANTVGSVSMLGSDVETYLANIATKTAGSGAYAQISGVNMTVNCEAQTVDIISIDGQAFDASAQYLFTIPSFSASGGDDYPIVQFIDSGFVDAQVLADYMSELGDIKVADFEPAGEIEYINSAITSGCQ